MISGLVSAQREATVTLDLGEPLGRLEAVIDTGFNGFVTLPEALIGKLSLARAGTRRAALGDGQIVELDVFLGKIPWHGQEREVLVLQAEGGPLIGMSLLWGSRLILEVTDGGRVTIEALTTPPEKSNV